jgi:Concanavalin A-like lectin/glucanases superfamily
LGSKTDPGGRPGRAAGVAQALTPGGVCEKNDGNPPNADSGFVFGVDGNGALHFTMELSVENTKIQTTNGAVGAGAWVQIAFTWDGTQPAAPASAAAIFINGILQTNGATTNGSGALDASKASNSQPFRIGNASYDVFAGSFYGKIAYLATYKGRLLTAADMMTLDAKLPIVPGPNQS